MPSLFGPLQIEQLAEALGLGAADGDFGLPFFVPAEGGAQWCSFRLVGDTPEGEDHGSMSALAIV